MADLPLNVYDYILFDEPMTAPSPAVETTTAGGGSSGATMERGLPGGKRVAFKTKSEVDVMDDGFKWRKYGKKLVKNSPSPRNYYRCSTDGCSVKKRVERDRDDPSYVITTYDGVHNHDSADGVYYATRDAASGEFVVSGRYRGGVRQSDRLC